jgi:hypothetical protein
MPRPDPDGYAWLSDESATELAHAGCVTVVTGNTVDGVLAAFGAETGQSYPLNQDFLAEAQTAVSVAEVAGAVVAVEFNGYQGSRSEVLGPASKNGKAASVFWNVNGVTEFTCARRTRTLATVDLGMDTGEESVPRSLLPLLSLAEDEAADLVAVGMLMVEKFIGVAAVTPSLIQWLGRAYVLHPPVEDMAYQSVETTMLRLGHQDLVDLIAAASPETLRSVAEVAAAAAVQSVGLDADPAAASVTSAFGAAVPETFTRDAQALLIRVHRESDLVEAKDPSRYGGPAGPEMVRAWHAVWAVRALRYATHPDPLMAALGALDTGWRPAPDILDAARKRLSGPG